MNINSFKLNNKYNGGLKMKLKIILSEIGFIIFMLVYALPLAFAIKFFKGSNREKC